jgi:hypothetical protein
MCSGSLDDLDIFSRGDSVLLFNRGIREVIGHDVLQTLISTLGKRREDVCRRVARKQDFVILGAKWPLSSRVTDMEPVEHIDASFTGF